MQWLRLHGTTVGAIVLSTALTSPYALQGIRTLLGYRDDVRLVIAGAPPGQAAAENAALLAGLVAGAASLVATIIIVGLVLRRQWAREAGMAVFGFFGLVATLVSITGLFAEPPAPNADIGLATGLASFVVVALLLARPTGAVFRAHEHEIATRKLVARR
jgi:hypothetical protein